MAKQPEGAPLTSVQRRQFCAGCAVVATIDLNFSLVSSFLPLEADRRGVSPFAIGIIVSSMNLGSIIAAPVAARAVSHTKPEYMIRNAMACLVVSLVLMITPGFSTGPVMFATLSSCLRIMQGFSAGYADVAASTLVMRVLSPADTGRAMGWLQASRAMGQLTGPILGALLYSAGSIFFTPFLVSAGIVFIVMLFASMVLMDEFSNMSQPDLEGINSPPSFRLLLVPPILLATSAQASYVISVTALEPISSVFMHAPPLSLEPYQIALISSTSTLLFIILVPASGALVQHVGGLPQALVGSGLICFGYLLLGPTPLLPFLPTRLVLTWTGFTMATIGDALAVVTGGVLVWNVLERRRLAVDTLPETTASVLQIASSCGAVVGSVLGGGLTDLVGFAWATTILACYFGVVMAGHSVALLLGGVLSTDHPKR